jgi:hypothetical protein
MTQPSLNKPSHSRSKTNICLNMIVKNETKVLPRLFRSLKDYIDYYVIVDTGSADDTIALIQREMDAYGIPGEVHERPWVNFGVNRQQALDLARAAQQAEWLLFIDADEELGVSDPKFYEKLEPGFTYMIEKHHDGTRYAVPSLLHLPSSNVHWDGPVHNYLVSVGAWPKRLLKDAWIIYHSFEGAKSHGVSKEEKYLRDAHILEEHLKEHPHHPRSLFYLGQSYRDAGHLEKALEAYRRRTSVDGWIEEKFMAQLEVGRISIRLEKPEHIVLQEMLSAYQLRPTRAEPLYELARFFRLKHNYATAHLFAKAGVQTPRPDDRLFMIDSVYTWRLLDELAVSSAHVKDFQLAKWAGDELMVRVAQGTVVPQDDLDRITKNLAEVRALLLKKAGAESL